MGNLGRAVEVVAARFDADGLLVREGSSVTDVELTCDVRPHAATNAALLAFHAQMEEALGQPEGYLTSAWPGEKVEKDEAGALAECARAPAVKLPGSGHPVCGCRVSQCEVGGLAADAIRHIAQADVGLLNGGSIRAGLPAGAISRKNVLQMLPFLNEVAILRDVPGSVLRAALTNGVSRLGGDTGASSPSGRFLQVSATLRFDWFFENGVPKVGSVYVGKPREGDLRSASPSSFELMQDDKLYTARRSSAEHLVATKAPRCTATTWILIVAQCSEIP